MRELAARGWGGNMERLLIKNNGYGVSKLTRHPTKKCTCIPLDRKLVSVKFSGFALALPTFSLGFCGGQSVNSSSLMFCDSYLEVLLLLLLSLSAGTHDCCCRLKLKESVAVTFLWLVIPRDTDNRLRQDLAEMGSMAARCKSKHCDITIQFQGSNTGRWIELQLKSGFLYMFVPIKVFLLMLGIHALTTLKAYCRHSDSSRSPEQFQYWIEHTSELGNLQLVPISTSRYQLPCTVLIFLVATHHASPHPSP